MRLRSSLSTRSTTRSTLVTVVRADECGPPGSSEDAEGASWTWIVPMTVEESFGQKRGVEYDASPSMGACCVKVQVRLLPVVRIVGAGLPR